eukprot:scaffold28821_cov63-Phaeocystis_antarctica.AAC.2
MAASVVAPSSLMALRLRLQGMGGGSERAGACQRALTRKQKHSGGGGALELGDLRLVEDGSQRSGALGSDVIASETASEGQDGKR